MNGRMFKAILFLIFFNFAAILSFTSDTNSICTPPKVMVIMDDYIDGVRQTAHKTELGIGKSFLETGFPVVDSGKMEKTEIPAADLIYAHPGTVARIAKKYGAEIVITGRASADFVAVSLPYGEEVSTCEARIESRTIRVKDSMVIAMDKVLYTAKDKDKSVAAEKALSGVTGSFSANLIKKVTAMWAPDISRPSTIHIICENTTLEKKIVLEKALGTINNVTEMNEGYFENGILEFNVKFYGTAGQLVKLIRQQADPIMEANERTPVLIHIKFIKEKDSL